MAIYGRDRFYIYGVEEILKGLRREPGPTADADVLHIYVTSGMDIQQTYALFFAHPPAHYSIFITIQRYFDSLNRLFPGLIKLCLPEKIGPEELRRALKVMAMLAEQNQGADYKPDIFKFTNAERQIMTLLLSGHSVNDIAKIRSVTPTTISVQRNALMRRTGTKSLQELCSLYTVIRGGV